MPAAWYTVHLDSAPQGTVGQTAASITSGNLHVNSAYDPSNTGTALVYADSASDAIRTALTGGVVVNLAAVSLPPASYTFTPGTSSPSSADHTAFAVTPTAASSTWKVYLEDLTADPTVSDWDYNDFFWTVSVVAIDPATIQYVSIVANAPDAVIQPNTSTPTSFTVRRERGPIDVAVTVAYTARVVDGAVLASGSVTIAAGQTTAAINVLVPPSADPATVRTVSVELIDTNQPTIHFLPGRLAAATLYPADSVPSVGVGLPNSTPTVADPNAAFTTDGFFTRSGASVSQPLTVWYQLTAEEGINGTNTVDLGTFATAFTAGEDRASIIASVPAAVTPSPTGRTLRVTVLPHPLGTPYPYTPDPDASVARCRAEPPKPTPARKLIMLLGFWPDTDIGVAAREGMLYEWRNRAEYKNSGYDIQAYSPAFGATPDKGADWQAGKDPSDTEKNAAPGRGAYKVNYKSVKDFFDTTVAKEKPVAILAFGLNPNAQDKSWRVETTGRNSEIGEWIGFGTKPYGDPALDNPIDKAKKFYVGGPDTMNTKLPPAFTTPGSDLNISLTDLGLTPKVSPDAGQFLCDFMTYSVANQLGDTTEYAGFVHVGDKVGAVKGAKAVGLMVDGVIKALNKED